MEVENKLFRESLDSSVNVTFANPTPEQRWTCFVQKYYVALMQAYQGHTTSEVMSTFTCSFCRSSIAALAVLLLVQSATLIHAKANRRLQLNICSLYTHCKCHVRTRPGARRPLPCMRSTSTGDTKHVNSPHSAQAAEDQTVRGTDYSVVSRSNLAGGAVLCQRPVTLYPAPRAQQPR